MPSRSATKSRMTNCKSAARAGSFAAFATKWRPTSRPNMGWTHEACLHGSAARARLSRMHKLFGDGDKASELFRDHDEDAENVRGLPSAEADGHECGEPHRAEGR